MTDSATIAEAADLLRGAGWTGYAKAIEDVAARLSVAERALSVIVAGHAGGQQAGAMKLYQAQAIAKRALDAND